MAFLSEVQRKELERVGNIRLDHPEDIKGPTDLQTVVLVTNARNSQMERLEPNEEFFAMCEELGFPFKNLTLDQNKAWLYDYIIKNEKQFKWTFSNNPLRKVNFGGHVVEEFSEDNLTPETYFAKKKQQQSRTTKLPTKVSTESCSATTTRQGVKYTKARAKNVKRNEKRREKKKN